MKKEILSIVILLSVLTCLKPVQVFAQEKDSIFLYNGQVLIGDIKDAQFGEISIDDKDLKTIQVKLYKVKKLTTYRKFRIETVSKKNYIGEIKSNTKPGWVNIILENGSIVASELIELATVVPLEKNFFKRLTGNFSAGLSYTKSSDAGQVNVSSTVQYASRWIGNELSISLNGSFDSSGYSRDREDIGLFNAYNISPTWILAFSLNYERNLELSIARRYQELVGGGYKVLFRKDYQLLALSGISFNEEKSTAGVSKGLLVEIPISLRFNLFRYHHPNLQINSTQSGYISLSEKGRFRYAGNTSITWELVKDFHLTVSPYTNFDNQPPEGNSNFDYGIVVSITYTF